MLLTGIYLLLFASLVGCVVPRTFRLAGSARTLPPRAPRHLARLPRSAEYTTALPPQEAVEVAARVLSGRGFRLRRPDDADTAQDWVSAEKGYLREAGNLLFHLALLGVLVSVALGGLFGYKADRLLVQGQSFADTVSALERGERRRPHVDPVRALSAAHREHPFSVDLGGMTYSVDYDPGESTTGLFGGNSNWRGPVWFPLNFLIIEALRRYHGYLGDDFTVEYPTRLESSSS